MKKDEILGIFEFDVLWKRTEQIYFWHKDYDITFCVACNKEDDFTELQRSTYTEFCIRKEYLINQIENEIYKYYQSVYMEYRDMYGEEADSYVPVINSKKQLDGLVRPQILLIPKLRHDREIVLLLNTKWDMEYGIGLKIVNGEITIVGIQNDVL